MSMNAGTGAPGGPPPPPPGYAPQYMPGPGTTYGQPCPQCGVPSAGARSCPNCHQVYGFPVGVTLASPGRRLGAYALSILMGIVTLGIGWLIWDLVLLGKGSGQSPGKQLNKIRVVELDSGRVAGSGKILLRAVVKVIALHIVYGVLALFLLIDKDYQELWDKASNTVVINDPYNRYAPASAAGGQWQQYGAPGGYQQPPAYPPAPPPYQPGSYQQGPGTGQPS